MTLEEGAVKTTREIAMMKNDSDSVAPMPTEAATLTMTRDADFDEAERVVELVQQIRRPDVQQDGTQCTSFDDVMELFDTQNALVKTVKNSDWVRTCQIPTFARPFRGKWAQPRLAVHACLRSSASFGN